MQVFLWDLACRSDTALHQAALRGDAVDESAPFAHDTPHGTPVHTSSLCGCQITLYNRN